MAKTREATVEICIATLTDICTDTEARDADRIAAAKLLMDICQDKGEAAGELKIILKDVPGECNHAQLMSKRAYTSKHPGKARII